MQLGDSAIASIDVINSRRDIKPSTSIDHISGYGYFPVQDSMVRHTQGLAFEFDATKSADKNGKLACAPISDLPCSIAYDHRSYTGRRHTYIFRNSEGQDGTIAP